jgi:uncharacterized membrane protein YgcG
MIRRLLGTCICVMVVLLLPLLSHAQERIALFETVVRVNSDGELIVVERIEYDFGSEERRGIFREIPLRFQLGSERRTIGIRDIEVRAVDGEPIPHQITEERARLRVRIGDPDRTVTGQKGYVLSYTVSGALLFLPTVDELYWNVIGSTWSVPIDVVRAQVILGFPEAEILQASCYAGVHGSTRPCAADRIDEAKLRYEVLHERVPVGGGVTVAVGFPKGLLEPPQVVYSRIEQVARHAGGGVAFVVVLASFLWWYRRGRDPSRSSVVVRQFGPPTGISPAEAGVIVDGVAHSKDIVAQLIELARAGFFTIHQFEEQGFFTTTTDYLLEQHHASEGVLYEYDRALLDALFVGKKKETVSIDGNDVMGVKVSSLAQKLASEFAAIQKVLYTTVTERGFFARDPQRVRIIGVSKAVGFGLLGGVVLLTVPLAQSITNIVGLVVSGLAIGGFGLLMPVRTREGVRIKEWLLGLKEYLSVAERDRLAFHNDPNHMPEEFDALLPYAMVLGVEKQWAALFAELFTEPPQWFVPAPGHAFSASMFAADMKGFASAMGTAGTSASSGGSGGGGSVGGGAGGGGGGSW